MKILQVSNFDIKKNFRWFYNCDYKLYFGLIENGHAVYQFSNRDIARQQSIFKSRFGAKTKLNRKLIECCRQLRPELLIIGLEPMIENSTLQQIKEELGVKLIHFNVDAFWIERNYNMLLKRSEIMDAIFVTTAGDALNELKQNCPKTSFIPNPVIKSVDKYKCFENNNPEYDFFFGGSNEKRVKNTEYLINALPDAKFNILGQKEKPLTYGQKYWDELTKCIIGLNFPQMEEDEYQPYLYSSDRIAQYMGNGLMTVIHSKTGYADYFEPNEEALFYKDIKELAEMLQELILNKEKVKNIAEKGWKKYHMLYNAKAITQYMVDVLLDRKYSNDYAWPVI